MFYRPLTTAAITKLIPNLTSDNHDLLTSHKGILQGLPELFKIQKNYCAKETKYGASKIRVRMGQQSQIQQNLKLRFVLQNKNSMLYHLHTGDRETNNTVSITYHQ
jgi:hypothetical protein